MRNRRRNITIVNNEIDYEKLAKAIIKAQKTEVEDEELRFKNTKLKKKNKAWCIICIVIAVGFFVLSVFGIILTLLKVYAFGCIKSISLSLIGMVFLLLRYNIIVMDKSNNIGMKTSMYSITIAVTSLVMNVLNIVFKG